jgi:hypothetical protein
MTSATGTATPLLLITAGNGALDGRNFCILHS